MKLGDNFDLLFNQNMIVNSEEVYGYIKDTAIIINPKNLRWFSPSSKGVIDKNGNLYLSANNYNIQHVDIVIFLQNRGIIEKSDTTEIYKEISNNFCSITRLWNKNIITLSNQYPNDLDVTIFDDLFDKSKEKNKNLLFFNSFPLIIAKDYLTKIEFLKFLRS